MITWITRVQARVADYPILYYGSFVFNATIYVILPWLAIRYLIARRFSLAAVAVMIGAVFIAYSDLCSTSDKRVPVLTGASTGRRRHRPRKLQRHRAIITEAAHAMGGKATLSRIWVSV